MNMKNRFTDILTVGVAVACLWAGGLWAADIKPVSLSCEHLALPLGVDVSRPRLSWQLESDRRGQKQDAYHILVASSRQKLDGDTGDIWDSGKVDGDQSLNVVYDGAPLQSRYRYFWKVKVWDGDGRESDWSDAASWGMGILSQDEWRGRWIKSELELYDYQKELKKQPDHNIEVRDVMYRLAGTVRKMTADIDEAPAVWMRKEFTAKERPRRATAYVSGLGFYELHLNGRKTDDCFFNTTIHDYGKSLPYLVHDVTGQIQAGDNTIGVILGNGYFNPVIPSLLREYANDFIDTPRLRCELLLEYEDGGRELIVSDPSWRFTTDGPIRFNSLRAGEIYDARKELGDWSSCGFDDKSWKPALVANAPAGRPVNQDIPDLRVLKEIPPVSVTAHEGGWRFDLGVDNAGWARLKLRGEPGRKIIIRYPGADSHTLGRYQTCEYICKGGGDEVFEQRFSYNGHQFVDVFGLDYTPRLDDCTGLQVASDFKRVGSFSCSDEKLNALQEVHLRTIRNYNVQMPQDPVREKACWTQDVQTNFECTAYNFDLQALYRKWQFDHLDQVLPDGFVPCVVPSCFDGPWINGPWWGGMVIYNPWQLYQFYGDRRILEASYPGMKKHFSYLSSIAKDHIVSWGLGDWQDAAAQKAGYGNPRSTTVPYTSTCAYFHFADVLRQTALLLGKSGEAARYGAQMEAIRNALHDKFHDAGTGVYDRGSQTAYVLALRLGIVAEKDRPRIVENLKRRIAEDDFHLSSGFVGLPFLLPQLTEEGLGDLAWKIATRESYPGWFDMIFNRNKTAFMEAWDGGYVQMPSLAGPIGAWFYRSLAGIRPETPGFKSFIIAPYTDTLDWVKCTHECPYGTIRSDWSRKDGVLTMEISVPVNTTATVFIPGELITEGGVPANEAEGVTLQRREGDRQVFSVASGSYRFEAKIKNRRAN